jgi:hypothetical protein
MLPFTAGLKRRAFFLQLDSWAALCFGAKGKHPVQEAAARAAEAIALKLTPLAACVYKAGQAPSSALNKPARHLTAIATIACAHH